MLKPNVFVTRLIPALNVDNVDVPAENLLAGLKGEQLPNSSNPEVYSK